MPFRMRLSPATIVAAFAALLAPSVAGAEAAWETWPSGRTFDSPVSRPQGLARVCSLDAPLCVHAKDGAAAVSALAIAESALGTLSIQSRLPPPMPDGDRGGSSAFDLYLADTGARTLRIGTELPTSMPVDRAATFAIVSARLPDGCGRRTAIARAVATGMLAAIDGGESGGYFSATASYLAASATGCWSSVLAGIDDAQRHPERAIIAAGDLDDDSSVVLPLYVDGGFGGGAPGSLLTALWYGGRQRTPEDATRFHNQPDAWEVLRRVGRTKDKKLDEIMLDFAIARGFWGSREDTQHINESAFAGDFGRVRFDASWPYATLPRRVAFTELEPTGSTYAWIDLAGAPASLVLGIHAEWESPVTMRWAVVRVGLDGEEVSRIEVTTERGIHVVERSIHELSNLSGLLIVGINVGEIAIDHPFRVDEAPYEPHGGTLYVAPQLAAPARRRTAARNPKATAT